MSEEKKKDQKLDQTILVGAGCLIVGFLLGMLAYHLIMGSSPAPQPNFMQTGMGQQPPPPALAPPTQNMPDLSAQIREAKLVLEKDPGNRGAWVQLGNMYFDSGRTQESIEAYTKALAINPNDANVLTDRGIMYRESRSLKEALADFRKAAQIDPRHYQSLYNEGITLLHDMNDAPGALKAWEELVRRNPPPEVAAEMNGRIEALKKMVNK